MAEIKQAKFIDQTGQEKDAVFIGAEKAIYDDSGKRLDQKLEEREKATGLLASDIQGILGNAGAEVSLQAIIDKVAEKITNELVSNSSLTQTLANYITKAMMSNVQVNDGNKVPTSALAYAMQQSITTNANEITKLSNNLGYYITSADDFSHTLIGGAAQNITLNSKITLEQYARILFLNYPGSNDGALLAIAPGDKIITAFRNNGVWEEKSSHFLATKSDLDNKIQCGLSSIGKISPGESISEITFPHSFSVAPKSVVGNIRQAGYGEYLHMQISQITATGFSVYIHNTSLQPQNIAIYWIACLG